jgi:hypothetical protein
MPRVSQSEEAMVPYAVETPKPEPPVELTEEQKGYFRQITADAPAGWITEATAPLLTQLVRHLSRARKVEQELQAMQDGDLGIGNRREMYFDFAKLARQESSTIKQLSLTLRLCQQTRTYSEGTKRALAKVPVGPKPWDVANSWGEDEEPQASN